MALTSGSPACKSKAAREPGSRDLAGDAVDVIRLHFDGSRGSAANPHDTRPAQQDPLSSSRWNRGAGLQATGDELLPLSHKPSLDLLRDVLQALPGAQNALPNDPNAPTCPKERRPVLLVALDVSCELALPVGPVARWHRCARTTVVAMPETAVNEATAPNRGETRSGRPGSAGSWSLYRRPRAWSARRRTNSGPVFRLLTLAMMRDRVALSKVSDTLSSAKPSRGCSRGSQEATASAPVDPEVPLRSRIVAGALTKSGPLRIRRPLEAPRPSSRPREKGLRRLLAAPCPSRVSISPLLGTARVWLASTRTIWPFLDIVTALCIQRAPPAAVLLENVTGFLTSRGGADLADVCRRLAAVHYVIDVLFVDARWFRPQGRPRLFVAARQREQGGPWQRSDAQPSRLHPAAVRRFDVAHPDLPFVDLPLPAPPTETPSTLVSVLENLPPDDARWWPEDRTAALVTEMAPQNRRRVDELLAGERDGVATMFRRRRNGRTVGELRPDRLAGCLRTHQGGSSVQFLWSCRRIGRSSLPSC